MVVLSRNEIGTLKKIIDNRDKEAFMVVLPNAEAIGYGFKNFLSIKKERTESG